MIIGGNTPYQETLAGRLRNIPIGRDWVVPGEERSYGALRSTANQMRYEGKWGVYKRNGYAIVRRVA